MKVIATKTVYFRSERYEAGDVIECNENEFKAILQPFGCELHEEKKIKQKEDRAIKELKSRDN